MSLRRAQGRGGGFRANNTLTPEPQVQGRPLPSQRAGSQQSTSSFRNELAPQTTGGSATSAQDRLKARLWGSGKPQSASSSQNPSPATSPAPQGGGMRSPYDRPQPGGGYAGGSRQQSNYNHNTSANSPWSGGNDDPYGPSYNSAPSQPQPQPPERRRLGLPSGPRMR